ncbi:SRPBCC domain-containing protein [Leptospira sp. WS39.C2]
MYNQEVIVTLEEKIIRMERTFNAPLKLVWEVWTNPLHLEKWWGPKGFTNPTVEFDFKVGGSYRIVMRSPDGVDYPVTGKFLEITPYQSFVMTDLVDEHPDEWVIEVQKMAGVSGDRSNLNSKLRVLFEELNDITKVVLLTEFSNNQIRDGYVNSGMKEGWSQSFEKIESNVLPNPNELVIEKKLFHPIENVFAAFADKTNINIWWGPNGFITTTQTREFKVGGKWIYNMLGPDGTNYPNLVQYKEIRNCEYIEYLHGSGNPLKDDNFLVKIWFTSNQENQTIIKMKMTFPNTETRNSVVGFGAIEGAHQTLSRLNLYLN